MNFELWVNIFILDICFVLPAFIIIAVMTAKNQGLGLLLTPAVFIKGFTLLFAVGLGGLLKPLYGQTGDMGENGFYLGLAFMFLVLAAVYLWKLEVWNADRADGAD